MALEDIFRALSQQADKDVEAVLEEAREHARVIMEEAEEEAASMRESRILDAERSAKSRSAHSLNAVRLEARKKLAGVKENGVRDVFNEATTALGEIRGRADYQEVFKALAQEAFERVDADSEVHVDPADAELASRVMLEIGVAAPVKADISTAGGLIVEYDNGRIVRRNTLEDRLEKLRGIAQAQIAEILFA